MTGPVSGAAGAEGQEAAPASGDTCITPPGGATRIAPARGATRIARAAMHAHSLWSHDGRWPLGRVARLFGAMGCEAVLMSEHDTGFAFDRWDEYAAACAAASTARCRLIPGIEWSSPDNDWHFPSWGMGPAAEGRPVEAILEHVAASKGAAVLAHPRRREVWRRFDRAWVPHLAGVEVWNRKSDGLAGFGPAWAIARDHGLPPLAGVDFHGPKQVWPAFALFEIGAGEALTPEVAVQALRGGRARPAFGARTLVDADGARDEALHARMERMERARVRLMPLRR